MQNKKDVRSFAYDLVRDGKTQFHLLDEYEKSKMTGLIIKSTEKLYLWEYITEADFKNELPELLSNWLDTGNEELGLEILKTLKNNAILYASREIIETLDEQEKEWELNKQFNND